MYEVTKEFNFCAAHRLPNHPTCGVVHGHNYRVLVTFASGELDGMSMVIDFGKIKELVSPVIESLDHTDLNEVGMPDVVRPTAEEISRHIFDEICLCIQARGGPDCVMFDLPTLKSVTVFETPTSSARYSK